MKTVLLCLCLASTACALPFQYLPHYTGSRPRVPGAQIKAPFTTGFPQPGVPGAYSVEFLYPYRFGAGASGTNQAQTVPQYGFIKYSIPQPPGRQSVEVFYPFDFTQNRIMQNTPAMTNGPIGQDLTPYGFPPQTIPQQPVNMPAFDVNAHPSQDPLQQLQQDQPVQTSQAPAKV
ncbi:secretory calcium-binding phosphoprotein 5 [Cyprinodon tularosa]|uniref:Secretory calcium-binding phosphoprotein 5 n=1 Tax=Cyprinodon variegatus TaxID=28743 RepID=A0A3Q2E4L4_CYPVA|nr:secretory calcium-binding phosphoprotein 5 [Cyprinodon tularosa]